MPIDPLRRTTSFGRWVARYSVERLARDLAGQGFPIGSHAVYDWMAARRSPRPECATAIVRLSGGKLSFEDIYRHRTEMAKLAARDAGQPA